MVAIYLLLQFIYCSFFCSVSHAVDVRINGTSAFLDLPVGFNFSVGASFDAAGHPFPSAAPTNNASMLNVTAIQTLNGQGFFFPLLSTPPFTKLPDTFPVVLHGFSLGFLFSPLHSDSTTTTNSTSPLICHIYLAVCGGRSGNYSTQIEAGLTGLRGTDDDAHRLITPYNVRDGAVAPLWIINPDSPLGSVDSSLVVVAVGSSMELQLRDHNGMVMWKVSNASLMGMHNNGELLIYNGSRIEVWRSSTQLIRDTLFQWQILNAGMELRSSDSAYSARMENGGLVLYSRKAHFMDQYPSPYWVLPVPFRNVENKTWPNLNALTLSSPCDGTRDFAYTYLAIWNLYLYPGSCIENFTYIKAHLEDVSELIDQYLYQEIWAFIKLENNGRLNMYKVTHPPYVKTISTEQSALDAKDATYMESQDNSTDLSTSLTDELPVFLWGECDVPMACGPLGVCTPGAASLCTCPLSLDPLNKKDLSQGCIRPPSIALPVCHIGDEHNSSTRFLQMNNTATIFLFSGWTIASMSAPVETCQRSCSSNCSCNGFFYQEDISACFLMSEEISLLIVTDRSLNLPKYAKFLQDKPPSRIIARNYATYIKVSLATNTSNSSSSPSPNSPSPEPNSKGIKASTIAIIAIIPLIVVLGLVGFSICIKARWSRISKQESLEEEELQDIFPLLPSRFTFKDLQEATEGFSRLLGVGGFGSVYAGVLPGERKVAVKVLQLLLKGQTKQFLAEVATVGRTNHHNIVRLVGFCWEASHRLLVYEYVERGSLDRWLFTTASVHTTHKDDQVIHPLMGDEPDPPLLDWQTRYNVALGIARGLSYLHEECKEPILHFDIKPQNILLDDDFVPKLADFGLSRLMQRDESQVATGLRGTPGYIAPEWVSQGLVSKKSDMYSMGMVMLEIVGGRKNVDHALLKNGTIDPALKQAWYFPSWAAKKCEQGLMMEIVDKRLQLSKSGVDEEQAKRLIYTAFWCIQEDPRMRPYAPTVVRWLEGSTPVTQPPPPSTPSSSAASISWSTSTLSSY